MYENVSTRIVRDPMDGNESIYEEGLTGKILPNVDFGDPMTGKIVRLQCDSYFIVVLFSTSDCEPCLGESLKLLAEAYDNNQNVLSGRLVAIAEALDPIEVLKWKKISDARFQFLLAQHDAISNAIGATQKPLLLLLDARGRIVSALYITQRRLPLLVMRLSAVLNLLDKS